MADIDAVYYLRPVLDPAARKATIARVVRHLKPMAASFDAIAIRGTSGLLIGPAVADKLGKTIIVVRKRDDGSHSSRHVEGGVYKSIHKYIIIDDLVATGATVKAIIESIDETANSQCVGVYCYHDVITSTSKKMDENNYSNGPSQAVRLIQNAVASKHANKNCLGAMAKWL